MKVLDTQFCKGFATMANDSWNLGYHERNGGNFSYRLTDEEIASVRDDLNFDRPFAEIGTEVPDLAGMFFMFTGSGKFIRWVKEKTAETCCLIEIDSTGTKYRIVWGLTEGGRPTSELPTHLMNHQVKMKATDGAHRVIFHCHPTNLIAMTFVVPLNDKDVTRALWESMTECPVIFPDGVGVIPWMSCGGRAIAVETAKKMEHYDAVIWAHHGLFCSADTFDNAIGFAHCVEKSADIYMKVRAVTDRKLQTITKENFLELAKDFGLVIKEEFLD
ncbi:MAG: rhamnulose-1-phosphate aldolase [Clostridia bacterium]|nr:rhamnulose-1-phosphate aldolase [Clostridia bacterium]